MIRLLSGDCRVLGEELPSRVRLAVNPRMALAAQRDCVGQSEPQRLITGPRLGIGSLALWAAAVFVVRIKRACFTEHWVVWTEERPAAFCHQSQGCCLANRPSGNAVLPQPKHNSGIGEANFTGDIACRSAFRQVFMFKPRLLAMLAMRAPMLAWLELSRGAKALPLAYACV